MFYIKIKLFYFKIFTLCLCVLVVNNIYAQAPLSNATDEEYWLDAVWNADLKKTIKLTEKFNLKINKVSSVSKKYENMARKEGVNPAFLTKPFNKLDFRLWYDAWFLKNRLEKFGLFDEHGIFDVKDHKNRLKLIFEKVTERIKPFEKEKAIIPWPTGIWVRKFGLCDRQSWLFAELAYQAGFETQIVYLVNPDTGVSPHTICEVLIEDDKGKVTRSVADPFSKVLLEGKSVADLANDKELMKKIWPDKKEWWKALPNSIFWTPSYPQDYCVKNQLLYKNLKAKLDSACPRFGEDPEKRMLRYKKLTNGNKGFKMGLWYYPFRVLKRELETNK